MTSWRGSAPRTAAGARSTAGCATCATTYADRIRARFPDIPRLVSGYPLQQLLPENKFNVARALVGTECTLALILSAKVKLIPNPHQRVILVLGFDDIYQAGDHVPDVNEHKPIALEGLDDVLIGYMKKKHMKPEDIALLPEGGGWLMAEFGSDDMAKTKRQAEACMKAMQGKAKSMKLVTDQSQMQMLWAVRESGLGATAKLKDEPANWPGWEDSAVAPKDVGNYLRDLRKLYDKYGYEAALYGHFGQGCIHCRVSFDLFTADGIAAWLRFLNEGAHLIAKYKGSLSGEHGDGQARGELLPIMFGDEIYQAFREYKRIWDPQGRMNPGKVVDAYQPDENLRMGTHYRPWEPETKFSFAVDDYGSFAYAANRCVGVGNCRSHDHKGVMCPSYRVTQEEMHSTRGRARLLFEMLEGAPLKDRWKSEAVKEALDLCLACKGCKGECPVNVDMATYKAEFLSHYYEGKRRPVWAYAFGLIPWWARLGSPFARVINAVTQTPGLSAAAKALAKIAPQRSIPPFAEQSFRDWWSRRGARPNAGGPPVILWADTFNTYFHPATARHAVEVLEAAGYDVTIPERRLCCGRPLYDYGMVDLAKVMLREILETLRPQIEAGTPVVGLEPSCVSVFKDELLNLFPNDHDARRLSAQTMMLGDFLDKAERWAPPQLHRKVVLHGHCHHKSVLGMDGDARRAAQAGRRARRAGRRLLRDGGRVRLRGRRALRRLDQGRRAGVPAQGPCHRAGRDRHRRRLLVPRADGPDHRPPGLAPGRRDLAGDAARPGRTARRVSRVRRHARRARAAGARAKRTGRSRWARWRWPAASRSAGWCAVEMRERVTRAGDAGRHVALVERVGHVLREQLEDDRPGVARVAQAGQERPQVEAALAQRQPVEERARPPVVRHLRDEDAVRAAREARLQVVLAGQVPGVGADAERVVADRVDHVERVLEVPGERVLVHRQRVERLERQPHARAGGVPRQLAVGRDGGVERALHVALRRAAGVEHEDGAGQQRRGGVERAQERRRAARRGRSGRASCGSAAASARRPGTTRRRSARAPLRAGRGAGRDRRRA